MKSDINFITEYKIGLSIDFEPNKGDLNNNRIYIYTYM